MSGIFHQHFFYSLFWFCLAVGLSGKVLLFLTETNTSFVKLTPEKPLSLSAFTLCMRVTTELQDERDIILFTYRTPKVDELNVWREKDRRVSLYIQSSGNGVFFFCLLSPSSRPTCASPGTLWLVSLPSGWMDVEVCSRSIEKVSQSVLVAPSCSAKMLINMLVALMQSRVL